MFSNKRHIVITLSVIFESYVSNLLCSFLDIDFENSKAFGNTSQGLSFSNRLTILLDMKVIDKNDKLKVTYFSEIRNQFAHNIEAIDFTSCFSFIDMNNKLRKLYKAPNNTDTEESYENHFFKLYADLLEIYDKVMRSLMKRNFDKGRNVAKQNMFDNLIDTLKVYTKNDEILYKKIYEIFRIAIEKTENKINMIEE